MDSYKSMFYLICLPRDHLEFWAKRGMYWFYYGECFFRSVCKQFSVQKSRPNDRLKGRCAVANIVPFVLQGVNIARLLIVKTYEKQREKHRSNAETESWSDWFIAYESNRPKYPTFPTSRRKTVAYPSAVFLVSFYHYNYNYFRANFNSIATYGCRILKRERSRFTTRRTLSYYRNYLPAVAFFSFSRDIIDYHCKRTVTVNVIILEPYYTVIDVIILTITPEINVCIKAPVLIFRPTRKSAIN